MYQNETYTSAAGIILLISGIFLLFIGQRFYRASLSILLGLFGFFIVLAIHILFPLSTLVLLSTMIPSVILFTIFGYYLNPIGILVSGAFSGFIVALFVNATISSKALPVSNQALRFLIILVLLFCGILFSILVNHKAAYIINTSIIGSFLFVLGIDCFCEFGLILSISIFFNQQADYIVTLNVLLLLLTSFILFIIGILIQYLLTAKNPKVTEEEP